MGFELEAGVFLAYATGVMIVCFFGKLLIWPLKKMVRILANSGLGAVVIILINLIGGSMGISVPINAITAVTVGLLGVPGAVGLLVCCVIF